MNEQMSKISPHHGELESPEHTAPPSLVPFWAEDGSLDNMSREEYEKLEDEAWDFVYKACPDATTLYGETIDILDLKER